ncbi:MAG: hypothetical protein J0H48_10055 [Nitrosospira multiformis]|nr:hypothetical protein [Nitrosospira multiformis]
MDEDEVDGAIDNADEWWNKSVAKLMIITAAPSSALMDNNVTSTSSAGFPQYSNGYRRRL